MEPATLISRSQEEQEALAAAARASTRKQIWDLLVSRGLTDSPDLQACPRCGDRIIIISQAATWVRDRKSKQPICAPCGTEIALMQIMQPGGDEIGGEG